MISCSIREFLIISFALHSWKSQSFKNSQTYWEIITNMMNIEIDNDIVQKLSKFSKKLTVTLNFREMRVSPFLYGAKPLWWTCLFSWMSLIFYFLLRNENLQAFPSLQSHFFIDVFTYECKALFVNSKKLTQYIFLNGTLKWGCPQYVGMQSKMSLNFFFTILKNNKTNYLLFP